VRRRQYGIVQDEHGRKTVVKQRIVAQALDEAQRRIAALEHVIKQGKAFDERRAKEHREQGTALARLQTHWWILLGRFLRLVRLPRA
jgi:hypothetical protein